ncbi:hypothetical protein [Hydrogenibacillus sp. N12]|uniref:hypothetical protein n=1 Tax=Hydrogenibacillus sp. N12 TaxID=2866627 RepID=UPI001C7D5F96|nr:hypothetical protein [Hydrogenibacillus sp. N12]QZA32142.1 hypothetical protein K2M58_07270 [Hydrogenibacillus sp. N12]
MTNENLLSRVVFAFLLYRVVSRFSFYVPIFVVALVVSGFSFLKIGGILFVYGLSTLIAGNFGRRVLEERGPVVPIVLGEILKALSNAIIGGVLAGIFGSPWAPMALAAMLFAQLAGGIGYAMAAIGDGSYLSHAARSLHAQESSQQQAQARSSSAMFMSFLAAGIVGAMSFRIVSWLPFAMTAGANLMAGLIAGRWLVLSLRDAAGDDVGKMRVLVSSSGSTRINDRGKGKVRQGSTPYSARAWIAVLSYALLRSTVIVMQLLILPVWFFLDMKIDVVYFGLLFALYTLSGFLGGRFYPVISTRTGEENGRLLMFVVTALSLALAGLIDNRWLAFIAPVGAFAGAGMVRPAFLPELVRASTRDGKEANAVSDAERIFGLLTALLYLIGGIALHWKVSPAHLSVWSSGMLFVLGGLLWWRGRWLSQKVKRETHVRM